MLTQNIVYIMVLLQILVGSIWLPIKLITFAETIISKYPKKDFPKLYPYFVNEDYLRARILVFKLLAFMGLTMGVVILAVSTLNQQSELLGWDNNSVILLLYLFQALPLLLLSALAPNYFKMMRLEGTQSIRKATLKPRSIFSYASKKLGLVVLITFIVYIVMLFIISQKPFEGFAGVFPNFFGVLVVNSIFAMVIFRKLYGKLADPYKTAADRISECTSTIRMMLVSSLLVSTYLTISLTTSWLGLKAWGPVFQTIFFSTMFLLVVSNAEKISDIDYSVYEKDYAVD